MILLWFFVFCFFNRILKQQNVLKMKIKVALMSQIVLN